MPRFNLINFVEENGLEKCYFLIDLKPLRKLMFIKYTTSNDSYFPILCKIDEEKYKVKDGYKVTLVPIQDLGIEFEKKDFYQMDFEELVNSGFVQPFVKK